MNPFFIHDTKTESQIDYGWMDWLDRIASIKAVNAGGIEESVRTDGFRCIYSCVSACLLLVLSCFQRKL